MKKTLRYRTSCTALWLLLSSATPARASLSDNQPPSQSTSTQPPLPVSQAQEASKEPPFPEEQRRWGMLNLPDLNLSFGVDAPPPTRKSINVPPQRNAVPSDMPWTIGNRFRCRRCPKTFRSNSNWRRHERLHFGIKNHACRFCGKRFSAKYNAKVHEATHSGERPFECRTCGKRFSQKSNYNTHLKMHRGEKPYPCLHCPKKYLKKISLDRHMRIHTDEKPFACTICDKAFRQKGYLKRHACKKANQAP